MSSTLLGILLAAAGLAWKWLSAAKSAPPVSTSNVLAKVNPPPTAAHPQSEAFAAWLVLRDVMDRSGATSEEIEKAASAVAMRIMLKPKEVRDEA
ncbi:hypothetical protein GC197_03320 [bacterium]|nr:hypothetical protein [bacterium]